MISCIRGSIHQGHEAFSEHSRGRQCAFMSLSALLLHRSYSVNSWTQTNIDDILFHGDRMYLHSLRNELVPDTSSLSINELPKVATSLNNVEYCLNYSQFYQGRIDRSFCGEGPFCSLKQVLINAFSDSVNAMIVLDGYIMAVIKDSESFYLFDSHARNSRGMPDENGTAVVLEFSELNELQNHIETLASYLNVSVFEITPVHAHASFQVHQLFDENNVTKKAMKSLLETHVPVTEKEQNNLTNSFDYNLSRFPEHAESNRKSCIKKIALRQTKRDRHNLLKGGKIIAAKKHVRAMS